MQNNSIGLNYIACKFYVFFPTDLGFPYTLKPVCNDHLYYKIYYLWLFQ